MSGRSDSQSDGSRGEGRSRTGLPPLPAGTGENEILAGAPPPDSGTSTGPQGAPDRPPAADEAAQLRAELAERTADLQRVKAEYDNYRKRVRRDRLALREIAVANVLRALLPVLDAVDRARELGQVHGGFQQVTEELEAELAALGLRSFGEVGEPFDPTRHEALCHAYSPEVDRTTCSEILAPGYQVGGCLLRPAQVAVTEPPTDG